jgi:uncharacterized membrane protein
MKGKWNLRTMTLIGLMAALVFATSGLRIEIPLPVDKAAVHFGNVMCVLSGLLLGPIGGLASGIGSFFYDLTNPLYAPEAFITFINKFFIGFIAGLISHAGGRKGRNHKWNVAGAIAGSVTYVVLYLTKSFISSKLVFDLTTNSQMMLFLGPKALTSLTNAVIACVVAVPLCAALRRALDRSGLADKMKV